MGQSFSKHVHQGYCIGLVESGAHGFYCKGRNHVGLPGSIILVNSDEVHTGHNASEVLWCYHAIYPQPKHIAWALEREGGDSVDLPWFSQSVVEDTSSAFQIARLVRSLTDDDSALSKQCQFVHLITQLVGRFSRSRNSMAVGREKIKINYIKQQLQDRLLDDVSLVELAEDVDWSPSYLNRAFKKVVGLPPHAFQVQCRIEQAQRYLERGLTVVEAALASGFSDQSHLHRHFIRSTGITPGIYRSGFKQVKDL